MQRVARLNFVQVLAGAREVACVFRQWLDLILVYTAVNSLINFFLLLKSATSGGEHENVFLLPFSETLVLYFAQKLLITVCFQDHSKSCKNKRTIGTSET